MTWTEFRSAFRAHYIPTGMMRRKRHEYIDLKQSGRFVHDNSKLFNHLVQYAPDQVDTDDKKDCFMIGLSTKQPKRMALSNASSRMMRSTPTRRQRRGSLWQLRPVVLH
jgi:hypothetical protein